MLSIQPVSFKSQYSSQLNKVSFKGYEEPYDGMGSEEETFWQEEARKLEELAMNEKNPKFVRKGILLLKDLFLGIAAASAVIWGGNRAGEVLKSSYTRFKGGKIQESLSSIAKPVKKGLNEAKKQALKLFDKGAERFENSDFGKKVIEKYNKLYEGNKVFKFVVDTAKGGATKVGNLVRDIVKSIKSVSYDDAVKTFTNVTGTGTGVAATYEGIKNDFPVDQGGVVIDESGS